MVSYTWNWSSMARGNDVLILIVVDNGLVPLSWTLQRLIEHLVLILIVVDNGLVLIVLKRFWILLMVVLILIVVDNGLVLDLTRHY